MTPSATAEHGEEFHEPGSCESRRKTGIRRRVMDMKLENGHEIGEWTWHNGSRFHGRLIEVRKIMILYS